MLSGDFVCSRYLRVFDEWVNGWINEWVVSGPSKHIDIVDSWNYPSEIRSEIKAGNKVWGSHQLTSGDEIHGGE